MEGGKGFFPFAGNKALLRLFARNHFFGGFAFHWGKRGFRDRRKPPLRCEREVCLFWESYGKEAGVSCGSFCPRSANRKPT